MDYLTALLYLSGVVSWGLVLLNEQKIEIWFAIPLVLFWPVAMPVLALYFATSNNQ